MTIDFEHVGKTTFDDLVGRRDGSTGRIIVTEGERTQDPAVPTAEDVVRVLSRKAELTNSEISFIVTLADFGANLVTYLLEKYDTKLPVDEQFIAAAQKFSTYVSNFSRSRGKKVDDAQRSELAKCGVDRAITRQVMAKFVDFHPTTRDFAEGRRVILEECAMGIAVILSGIIDANPRLSQGEGAFYILDKLSIISDAKEKALKD